MDNDSYLRGARDMALYLATAAEEAAQAYEERIDDPDEDVCSECGDDLMYNPATGDQYCPKHE